MLEKRSWRADPDAPCYERECCLSKLQRIWTFSLVDFNVSLYFLGLSGRRLILVGIRTLEEGEGYHRQLFY